MSRRGFTLLELLVTIGIFSVVAAIGLPSVKNMQDNSLINGTAQELASTIRVVQNRALTSQQGANHGLSISANGKTYTEFYSIPPAAAVNGSAHTLTRPTITTNTSTSITFSKLLGVPDTARTYTITLGSLQKNVVVSAAGTITIQ